MALQQVSSQEVPQLVGAPAPLPPPADGRPANVLATAVPLLLQVGLSGAIKILGPAAPTGGSQRQYLVASKFYASAVFLTFAFDMVLVICVIAYYAGSAKPPVAGVMKPLMIAALAVSFATALLGTVLNILA